VSRSTVLYVCPAPDGGWSVFGSDTAPALSTFDARSAAMEYACSVARKVPLAEVHLLGWNGSVEEYRASHFPVMASGEQSAVREMTTI
jgi:uncharacterized protein DUF2188